ncbi:MAG: phosphatidate cytidylyltransferase [Clostridia bacterium]|nr:phosphatidate cytidylyltransferase [Clostridia bacterium]
MSTLKIRVISGVNGAVFVLLALFSNMYLFHLLIAAASLVALYELMRTFGQQKKWQLLVLNFFFGALLLISPFIQQSILSGPVMFVLVVHLLLLLFSSVVWNDTIKFSDVSLSFFMMVYVVIFPLHLTYTRMMDHGVLLLLLVFMGAWMPDTFAYFSGMLFGKHKLIPKISPKKTVEGAIGAVVGAVLSFTVYGLVLWYYFDFTVNFPALIFLSLLCGVAAQFGDLAASVIKREWNIKDFGNLIPGHGGALDRIDSLIFIAPLVYYFLLVFEVICK